MAIDNSTNTMVGDDVIKKAFLLLRCDDVKNSLQETVFEHRQATGRLLVFRVLNVRILLAVLWPRKQKKQIAHITTGDLLYFT